MILLGLRLGALAVTDEEIARAVKELGAGDYRTREAATKLLWSAGRAATNTLQKAGQSDDPEVAIRARQILTNIQCGITPDTPPAVAALVQRYAAADLPGKQAVVVDLVGLGDPAQPALLALAAAEPRLERRLEIFQPVLEPTVSIIEDFLGADKPTDEQTSRGLKAMRLLEAMVPEDPTVSLRVVVRLDQLGRRREADDAFARAQAAQQKLCERFPATPDPHNNLAWLCAVSRRQLDDGLVHAQRAVELAPNAPAYLDTLAEIRFQKGDKDRALELIKKCIELEPDNDYFQKQRERFSKGRREDPPPEP